MRISFNKILMMGTALMLVSNPVMAQDKSELDTFAKERFQFRLRGIDVLPDSTGSASITGEPKADNSVVPEFDISYFFTDHIAAELILAVSKHDLTLKDTGGGDLDLGETLLLPPTLTLQYHFTPEEKFSPYVGAGLNYTLPFAENNGSSVTSLEADAGIGYVLQAGTDYWFNENWGWNIDVKKVWVDVDASINSNTITGNVELDPWIIGTGISYRF